MAKGNGLVGFFEQIGEAADDLFKDLNDSKKESLDITRKRNNETKKSLDEVLSSTWPFGSK